MSVFTTKFNLNDLIYLVDTTTLTVVSLGVREIFIKQKLSDGSVTHVSYRGTLNGVTTEILEEDAWTSTEAKDMVLVLLAERTTEITGL